MAQSVKFLPAAQETEDQSLEFGKTPGEGNDCSLQYSCLDYSRDRAALWVIVHEVAKSWI